MGCFNTGSLFKDIIYSFSYKENRYFKCYCAYMTSQRLHVAAKCFQQLMRKRTCLQKQKFPPLPFPLYDCKKAVKVINAVSHIINLANVYQRKLLN